MRTLPAWLLFLPFGLSFAVGVWALPQQSSRIPIHWGPSGQPDRWGSPLEGLFMLPGVLLFTSLLVLAASPARPTSAPLLRVSVLGLGLLALAHTTAQAFGWDSFRATMMGLGVLFILMGPALAQSEPSSLSGPPLSASTLRRLGRAWLTYGTAVVFMSLLAPQASWMTATVLLGLGGILLFVVLGARHDRRRTTG
ncbi:DUF1648 domain-containing protein [Deinococcus deserti]|uniref:DUF1648 domain-containing protein n=1 Tax=Deinococcus deserti (strain DSM 17065 / CIP 109153 / LMG 22923 / VCD115) TaxID=546414 RepID=C1D3A1_DEIDV|nr:DUF1648 domain-containing protein [Deinococcus deserti]ACO47890.1 Hypothetical protein; putative membrane protein [Deinococcus deserti VCD115]